MGRTGAVAMMVLFAGACQPGGETWVEGRLGIAGASRLRAEAGAWMGAHRTPTQLVAPADARCPGPRVVLDVYEGEANTWRLEYSRVSKRGTDADRIHGVDDVRCLVLAAHEAHGRKRNFKQWMTVHLVERGKDAEQVVRVEGNDDELTHFLANVR